MQYGDLGNLLGTSGKFSHTKGHTIFNLKQQSYRTIML